MTNKTTFKKMTTLMRGHLTGLIMGLALTGSMSADNSAYVVVTYTHQFGTIDRDTGVFTQINADLTFQGVGLGVANGHLFTAAGYTLYQIDPVTGLAGSVGLSGIAYEAVGSTHRSLYALDNGFTLYLLNPKTGGAAPIGPTGIPPSVIGGSIGMSTNSSTLYVAGDTVLYAINTCTGKATAISTLPGELTAMVFEGGVLYGGGGPYTPTIFKVNPSTGAFTSSVVASGNPPPAEFYGFAPLALPNNGPAGFDDDAQPSCSLR